MSAQGEAATANWYQLKNQEEVESPALLLYSERVDENIRRMLAVAGAPARLRPHAKTHKLAEIAKRQMGAGVTKFKAATIAETEMLASAGAPDVLLAYQPVGPNVRRFLQLIRAFPQTRFTCLLDDRGIARELSEAAAQRGTAANVLLDVDCGEHRTGIPADDAAVAFYSELCRLPGLRPVGLHAYDGHIRDRDLPERKQSSDAAFAPVAQLRDQLAKLGLPVGTLVLGGTPTFPIHAARDQVECSPGTCVFWDYGYSERFADLDFLHAALVLTRVISRPGKGRWCLDLGHKAIASEQPHPRVHFLNAPSARAVTHNEEHLVVELANGADWNVGDCWYGVPAHICPTVALHASAVVVEQGRATARWRIEARDRHLRF